jgi:hypothetical protein
MIQNHQKHFLSLAIVVSFFFLASSSAVNKIHYGAFNYNNKVEDQSDEGNYLVLNDGTKIKGDKIGGKAGVLVKDIITIDNQTFAMKDVKGYRIGDEYYGRVGKNYIKRIVHGPRINVYVMFTEVTEKSNATGQYRTYTRTDNYAQKGENGPLVVFGSQKSIKELVADCPLAVQMADKSNAELKKLIKQNDNYLNSIFEVYNNNCKP